MEVSEGDTQDICTYCSSELSFPYLSAWLTHFPLPGLHSNISSTWRSFLTSLCKTATPYPSSPSPNQALPGLLLCVVFLYGGHLPDCLSIYLFICLWSSLSTGGKFQEGRQFAVSPPAAGPVLAPHSCSTNIF